MQLFDLTGRVAIVTGGNGGIGLGMARGMATAGVAIVVAARDEAKSVEAVRELEGLGAQAVAVRVDVTQEASCRAMVQSTLDQSGRLRHPGQQRRHHHQKAAAGVHARGMASDPRDQSHERACVARRLIPPCGRRAAARSS